MSDKALEGSAGNGPRILVVDDDAAQRRLCAEQIRKACQAEVIEAASGREALEAAALHDFAFALIDAGMPDMGGFELASLLRQQPRAEEIPFMFIADPASDEAFLKRCYLMGAVDVLIQGLVDPEILAQKIRVYLEQVRKRQDLGAIVNHIEQEKHQLLAENENYRRVNADLRQRATHDALTNLPNRLLFEDRCEAAVNRAKRSKRSLAIAFIDLDRFKVVNDYHGHATGDEVIRTIAKRLSYALRATDTVARLGGDEFGVLLEMLPSSATAIKQGEKLRRALSEPMLLNSELQGKPAEIEVGASIGIALFPEHGAWFGEVINRADMMMYEAKRSGGGVRVCSLERRERAGTKIKPLRERRKGKSVQPVGSSKVPGEATDGPTPVSQSPEPGVKADPRAKADGG